MGAFFELSTAQNASGYLSVPSPQVNAPIGDEAYFQGGYNVETHGSQDGGTIDAIQIEFPRYLRAEYFDQQADMLAAFGNTVLPNMLQHQYPAACDFWSQPPPTPPPAPGAPSASPTNVPTTSPSFSPTKGPTEAPSVSPNVPVDCSSIGTKTDCNNNSPLCTWVGNPNTGSCVDGGSGGGCSSDNCSSSDCNNKNACEGGGCSWSNPDKACS